MAAQRLPTGTGTVTRVKRIENCCPSHKTLTVFLFRSTCNSLSKFCPKLKHLDLASCTSITNLSLKALRWERSRCDLVWSRYWMSDGVFCSPLSSCQWGLSPVGAAQHLLVWSGHQGWHPGTGAVLPWTQRPFPQRMHSGWIPLSLQSWWCWFLISC